MDSEWIDISQSGQFCRHICGLSKSFVCEWILIFILAVDLDLQTWHLSWKWCYSTRRFLAPWPGMNFCHLWKETRLMSRKDEQLAFHRLWASGEEMEFECLDTPNSRTALPNRFPIGWVKCQKWISQQTMECTLGNSHPLTPQPPPPPRAWLWGFLHHHQVPSSCVLVIWPLLSPLGCP